MLSPRTADYVSALIPCFALPLWGRCGTNAAVTKAGRFIGTPSPNTNGVQ